MNPPVPSLLPVLEEPPSPQAEAAYAGGLWARGLRKAFGSTEVLAGLSIHVAPGEVVGLLGPNGAGKSTALRLMCGLARMDGGEARLAGVNVADKPVLARARLGFLAQDTLLYPRHTVVETLRLFAHLGGLAGTTATDACAHWMDRLRLHPLANRLVGTLSSGERQRANLARALVHSPRVIILDEPTVALDPETVDLLLQVIGALRDEGRAMLLCTHALADAELVVSRAVLLHAGRVVAQGTVDQLCQATGSHSLTAAFLALVRPRDLAATPVPQP